ncbi:hypothetical protein BD413DRAFT_283085 [Trametes elegans]|nr:hypothetical protein BD413DRAFT_283085 [Trametes elegans]
MGALMRRCETTTCRGAAHVRVTAGPTLSRTIEGLCTLARQFSWTDAGLGHRASLGRERRWAQGLSSSSFRRAHHRRVRRGRSPSGPPHLRCEGRPCAVPSPAQRLRFMRRAACNPVSKTDGLSADAASVLAATRDAEAPRTQLDDPALLQGCASSPAPNSNDTTYHGHADGSDGRGQVSRRSAGDVEHSVSQPCCPDDKLTHGGRRACSWPKRKRTTTATTIPTSMISARLVSL